MWQEMGEGDERRERFYEREPSKSAVWSCAWPMRDLDTRANVRVRPSEVSVAARDTK